MKKWVHLSSFLSFLQFSVDTSKINKAVVEIYVYVSDSSHFALLENGIRYDLEFRRYLRSKLMNFVKFLLSQYLFWYFNPQYLMSCCSDLFKTYYFLKEHYEVFQMDINTCKIPGFWRQKLGDQNFVSFDSGNIHIKECKKTGFTFSIELRTKFVLTHCIWISGDEQKSTFRLHEHLALKSIK